MKISMDDKSRRDLIAYRLSRAVETLAEADYNAKGSYYNTAISRLYYACFYAASALMLKYGIEASTHKGVRNQLGLHFIHEGILDTRLGLIYAKLFNARHEGDYEDFVYCDQNMYEEYRPQAEDFITTISKFIL